MGIKRYKNAIRESRANNDYLKYLKEKIDSNAVLLEAGQGKHTDGNIFAFLRCIEKDTEWKKLIPYVVVTKDSKKEAKAKFDFYGFSKYKLVTRNSSEYRKVIATAKYLITDNSFPAYFIKRPEQIYLNTWHGTPLKQLGRADIKNSTSIGNVQKNFLTSDYLLYPNTYTRDVMMKDYMIDRAYGGKTVIMDYPRNDTLFNNPCEEEIREKYNLQGKRIIAYMPTWRGSGRKAGVAEQINEAKSIIRDIESNLKENEVLYVNFHFLIGNNIDFSEFEKAKAFPEEYETYDFLALCDVLISDYSSVMIDFAQTGREVIMYMYDYDEYLQEKGFYFDVRELPFLKAYDSNELEAAMKAEWQGYSLDRSYVGNSFGEATKKLLSLITAKETDIEEAVQYEYPENTRIVYVGDLEDSANHFLTDKYIGKLSEEDRQRTVLAFEGKMKNATIGYLQSLPDSVEYMRVLGGGAITLAEYAYLNLYRNHGLFGGKAEEYMNREYRRLFANIKHESVEMLSTNIYERVGIISRDDAKTVFHRIPLYFYRRLNDVFYRKPGSVTDVSDEYDEQVAYDDNYGSEAWKDITCEGIQAGIRGLKCVTDETAMTIRGKLVVRSSCPDMELTDDFIVGSKVFEDTFNYKAECRNIAKKLIKDICEITCSFSVNIPNSEINAWYTSNMIHIVVNVNGSLLKVPIRTEKGSGLFRKTIYDIKNTEYICEFKRDFKYYRLIIRNRNVTDSHVEQIKLLAAFACHVLTWWNKPVLIYEKNCNSYEESGSVLFEYMVDNGYKNMRFVLNKEYPHYDRIENRYRKYIVNQFSFSHYYSMFASKSIIASEALGHALEKKSASSLFKNFVVDGSKNYVFLQHGVMYMVSLGSEQRSFFRKGNGKGKQRVVVSSRLEADHFTNNTGHLPEDMYICGLLKFDRSVLDDDADRIVVMLTWRPWEFVQGIHGIENTNYYRMLKRIIDAIPDELKEKLIVLPHPLVGDQVEGDKDDPVWKYYVAGVKYDDILKRTRLLITDYSSISYDAFYRGSNVIFCWKEKEQCMKEYGDNARLMLTEELAFGDVCYNGEELRKSVNASYRKEQRKDYLENYRNIVEFHDGNNTARFVEMAHKDGII